MLFLFFMRMICSLLLKRFHVCVWLVLCGWSGIFLYAQSPVTYGETDSLHALWKTRYGEKLAREAANPGKWSPIALTVDELRALADTVSLAEAMAGYTGGLYADSLLGRESVFEVVDNFGQRWYQSPLKALPEYDEKNWQGIYGKWVVCRAKIDGKDGQYLFLDSLCGEDSLRATRLYRQLAGRYGVYGAKHMIPARWVSGRWESFTGMRCYQSVWVTDHRDSYLMEQGVVVRHLQAVHRGSYQESAMRFNESGIDSKGRWFSSFRLDGRWDSDYPAAEMLCLEQDVNRLFPADTLPYVREVYYDLLLGVGRDGRLSVYAVRPTVLSPADRVRIESLQCVVSQLPSGVFGTFWTLDGRAFPYRYLRACCVKGRWRFVDTLLHYRKL